MRVEQSGDVEARLCLAPQNVFEQPVSFRRIAQFGSPTIEGRARGSTGAIR